MNIKKTVTKLIRTARSLELLAEAICDHDWKSFIYSNNETFVCCICGRVDRDKKQGDTVGQE